MSTMRKPIYRETMIDPTSYDAIVNAAALVYAGRASVTQIKS
jgi:hypothetical protein